jgi:predicted GTPase
VVNKKKIWIPVDQLAERIGNMIDGRKQEPLRVCVMGQTGVGKSSLMNALFGTGFNIDPVRPGTLEPVDVSMQGRNGYTVRFIDLPGVGESIENDHKLIPQYQQHLRDSDVVLWAIVADTRSFMYDRSTLDEVCKGLKPEEKKALLSKITFVLTKADLLTYPEEPAYWWLVKIDSTQSLFMPNDRLEHLIKSKTEYFQKMFISPYKEHIRQQITYQGVFHVNISHMTYQKGVIRYNDFAEESDYTQWCTKYPSYKPEFRRLYSCYQIIPCSSRFRYNLEVLMSVIINKLHTSSADRLKGFVEDEYLNRLPFSLASTYKNIELIDREKLKEKLQKRGEI